MLKSLLCQKGKSIFESSFLPSFLGEVVAEECHHSALMHSPFEGGGGQKIREEKRREEGVRRE